jgi:hypothetical protein
MECNWQWLTVLFREPCMHVRFRVALHDEQFPVMATLLPVWCEPDKEPRTIGVTRKGSSICWRDGFYIDLLERN